MSEWTPHSLPLYNFFERLRQNDFPLGIGEYEKLLRALLVGSGLGISEYKTLVSTLHNNNALLTNTAYPKDYLLRLSKLLWLKPEQSINLFEDIFEETYLLDFQGVLNMGEANSNQDDSLKDALGQRRTDESGVLKPDESMGHSSQRSEENDVAEMPTDADRVKPTRLRIAVGQNISNDVSLEQKKEFEKSKFLFTKNYFPIDSRKTQQNIRAFPSFRKVINTLEMDVDATIDRVIEKAFFAEVVFKKDKRSNSSLLLLIDHEGSMAAFDQLSEKIRAEMRVVLSPKTRSTDSALRTFYFYNVWGDYLYENKMHTQYKEFSKVIKGLKNRQSCIVIISDAGAAKGTYNSQRIGFTFELLGKLKGCTGKIVWLNPMPVKRWRKTTAEVISKTVAMFEANESGIKNAMLLLRGSNLKLVNL